MSTAIAKEKKTATIRDTLKSEGMLAELNRVVPRHITGERMARVALTALLRIPTLNDCDQSSFFRCLLDLSQWGLEPDGRRAHLIPFKNNKLGIFECQLIIDYKGYVELAYRSGLVKSIHADVIYEGDIFQYSMGEVRDHVPWFLRRDGMRPEDKGQVQGAYCRVELLGGTVKSEVMDVEDVERIRKRSKAANSGPWVTDWNEMAKKTVFRRVAKWLPLSAEFRDAVERDDDNIILDAESKPTTDKSRSQALLEKLTQQDEPAEPGPDEEEATLEQIRSELKDAKTVAEVEEIRLRWMNVPLASDLCDARLKKL